MITTDSKEPFQLTLTINPADAARRRFKGWGTSLCWWANALGSSSCRDSLADAFFAPPPLGLGLNVVRYNIGGGDNPVCSHCGPGVEHHFRHGGNVPGWKVDKDDPLNPDADARQLWFLVAARQRGADVFEAFANSPPWWMTASGCVGGAKNKSAANNLKPGAVDEFAEYLVQVMLLVRQRCGIEFQTLSPMNEPHPDACN
ncbi:O-glycosyl hydrolase family 30-domain-containing protein, partial [Entophlyctis helioformis]